MKRPGLFGGRRFAGLTGILFFDILQMNLLKNKAMTGTSRTFHAGSASWEWWEPNAGRRFYINRECAPEVAVRSVG
jgi:hypothetical protein